MNNFCFSDVRIIAQVLELKILANGSVELLMDIKNRNGEHHKSIVIISDKWVNNRFVIGQTLMILGELRGDKTIVSESFGELVFLQENKVLDKPEKNVTENIIPNPQQAITQPLKQNLKITQDKPAAPIVSKVIEEKNDDDEFMGIGISSIPLKVTLAPIMKKISTPQFKGYQEPAKVVSTRSPPAGFGQLTDKKPPTPTFVPIPPKVEPSTQADANIPFSPLTSGRRRIVQDEDEGGQDEDQESHTQISKTFSSPSPVRVVNTAKPEKKAVINKPDGIDIKIPW